jgi:uncharacterized protein (DUF305 family)
MRINRKTSFAIAASALALTAACGGNSASMTGYKVTGDMTLIAAATNSQPSPTFNDADVMFAQQMIPHHQQAIEMAELASTRASDPEIKELASKIQEDQQSEIETMQGWLAEWGKPTPSPGMMEDHEMPGAMSEEDMRKLESAQGKDFDKLFAQQMMTHHKGAIEMARTEETDGANPEAKELAKKIVTTQQEEVEQLQKILDRL